MQMHESEPPVYLVLKQRGNIHRNTERQCNSDPDRLLSLKEPVVWKQSPYGGQAE